ncbi:hypothetical protein SynBMKMC1_00083 [Synechococcus sp. BMK-MC-1]|nr:hypothetical protein SynBMKMC1_00083 [Synechococcus sp. BMK-MC-1]
MSRRALHELLRYEEHSLCLRGIMPLLGSRLRLFTEGIC